MGKLKAYQLNMVEKYDNAPKYRGLEQCYRYPSWEKERAFRDCMKKCKDDRGTNWTIVTHNKHMFTFAYRCEFFGIHMLVYITPYATHRIQL